ncbi:MAG TPA: hypothetical protein VGH99_00750 [Pseudonocardia sp.]|jgi:hypothetical protein
MKPQQTSDDQASRLPSGAAARADDRTDGATGPSGRPTAADRPAGIHPAADRPVGAGPDRPATTPVRYFAWGALVFVAVALVDTGLRAGGHEQPLDPTSGIPVPPRDLAYRATSNTLSIVWAACGGVSALIYSVREYVKTRSLIPFFLVLSAPLIAFPATVADVLGGAYMADGPHFDTVTILGRHMGLFVFAVWIDFGIFMYVIFTALGRGARTRVLWLLVAVSCVGDIVSEELMLPFGSYRYYGNQPLVLIHQLPWWWVPCNVVGCFLAATLAHRYRHLLTGWRASAMLVITPVSVLGVYGFTAMPSFIAVNGNHPWLVTQVLGLLTVALGVVTFLAVLNLVLARHPFDMEGTGDLPDPA